MRGDVLEQVSVVNVGLAEFADAVRAQGGAAVDVEWRPPAGGDPVAIQALTGLWGRHGERVAAANREVVERIESATPPAVGLAPRRRA